MKEVRFTLAAGALLGLLCWSAETSLRAVSILRLGFRPHLSWADAASYAGVGIAAATAVGLFLMLLRLGPARRRLLTVALSVAGIVGLQSATWYFVVYDPVGPTLLPLNAWGAVVAALLLAASLTVGLAAGYIWQLVSRRLGERRLGLALLLALLVPPLVALGTPAWPASSQPAPGSPGDGLPPNVVIISLDTLRADRLGCYGRPGGLSPNIDRLASEGLVFANCLSQSSWTIPSFCSLFTGLLPAEHGAGWPLGKKVYTSLRPEVLTLAERLSEAGYTCGGFQANSLMGPIYGVAQGYQLYLKPQDLRANWGPPLLAALWENLLRTYRHMGRKLRGSLVTRAARAWLEGRQQPFFAWLNLMECHAAYRTDEGESFRLRPFKIHKKLMNERERARARHCYGGAVQKADRLVGQFVDWLDAAHPNTILIVLADHGEELNDHGGRLRGWEFAYDRGYGHGHTLYQELLHVPLIICLPGQDARHALVESRVRLMDLYPTILGLLGLPEPKGLAAQSLLPLLEDEGSEGRPCLAESLLFGSQKRALVMGDLKCIEHEASGRCELYDLASDPGERHDLASGRPLELESLRAALNEFPHRSECTPGPVVKPPPRLERELKNLGYI
jgi:arylsulfatase A-like enzyme